MPLSSEDLVKRLRTREVLFYGGTATLVAVPLLDLAADMIEQLEIDLLVARENIGDLRRELQDKELMLDRRESNGISDEA